MGRFIDNDDDEDPFYLDLAEDSINGCFGINVIYELEDYHLSEIRKHRKEVVKELLRSTNPDYSRFALAVISINEQMKKVWSPILKEAGFKMIAKGKNGNNRGNPVYLWTKEINKIITPKRKPLTKKK